MNRLQEHIYSVLCSFSEICEKHSLRYFLVGGTLLGAVRHRGFIPWDDDVDVAMPEADYLLFLSLAKELPEHLIIESPETRADYPLHFSKLCDKTRPFKSEYAGKPCGVYVDIFPLVFSRKPTRWVRALYNFQHIIVYVLQVRYGWQNFIPYKLWYARLTYALLDCFSATTVKRIRDGILNRLRGKGCGYLFSPGGAYKADREFYPVAWWEKSAPVIFEGREFPAPVGWDAYLRQMYGEYTTLPNKNGRISRHL